LYILPRLVPQINYDFDEFIDIHVTFPYNCNSFLTCQFPIYLMFIFLSFPSPPPANNKSSFIQNHNNPLFDI